MTTKPSRTHPGRVPILECAMRRDKKSENIGFFIKDRFGL